MTPRTLLVLAALLLLASCVTPTGATQATDLMRAFALAVNAASERIDQGEPWSVGDGVATGTAVLAAIAAALARKGAVAEVMAKRGPTEAERAATKRDA